MAKKKISKRRLSVIKFIVITLLAVGIGWAAGKRAMRLFRHADYFKVRSVVIDPSLQFIDKRDLENLIGKNIFTADLRTVQRRLSRKYPQASRLRVVRRFPDQLWVAARRRLPLTQIQIQDRTFTLDEEGIMLPVREKEDKNLPLIVTAKPDRRTLVRGLPLRGADVRTALEIIKRFRSDDKLSSYAVTKINTENLSKIYVVLSNGLQVIVDRDKIAQKIRVLGVVLSQGKLDLDRVKYIDLRFKEPIIGKQ